MSAAQAEGAFYAPQGEHWIPSELTRGPWDPGSQHGGPPAALLARAIEACERREEMQIGRVTCDLLRPVPLAPLTVRARVLRPGRRVELLEASLSDERGEVMRATAWRLARAEVALPDGAVPERVVLPGPEEAEPLDFTIPLEAVGYHTAMEYRTLAGAFDEPGPATVWMRMRHPLVAGEETSPVQRVLVAADAASGTSSALDWARFQFINVDLTVHLHRMPVGEWVCLDAVTYPERSGIGMADTRLHDRRGPIGRGVQTLFVRQR